MVYITNAGGSLCRSRESSHSSILLHTSPTCLPRKDSPFEPERSKKSSKAEFIMQRRRSDNFSSSSSTQPTTVSPSLTYAHGQQLQYRPTSQSGALAANTGLQEQLWQPGFGMNNASNHDIYGMNWDPQQQDLEGYVAPFPGYAGTMTPAMDHSAPVWTNPFLQTSSAIPPNVYSVPVSNSFTLEDYWSHGPLTAPIPETQLLPLSSQVAPAFSLDDHSHSDPGNMPSPQIKHESFELQPSDYFSTRSFLLRGDALESSKPLTDRTKRVHSYASQAQRVDSSVVVSAEEQQQTVSTPTPTKARKREASEDTPSPETKQRRKRSYTTEATAKCRCDLCGRLFQRTYNLKAHKETHDPARKVPFDCNVQGCNKRFVRRTDLERHFQSVSAFTTCRSPNLLTHCRFIIRPGALHVRYATLALQERTRAGGQYIREFRSANTDMNRHMEDGCPHRREMRRSSAEDRLTSVAEPSTSRTARRDSTHPRR